MDKGRKVAGRQKDKAGGSDLMLSPPALCDRRNLKSQKAAPWTKEIQMEELPEDRFLRLAQIIGRKEDPKRPDLPAIQPIIPISKTSWLSEVKTGKFPQPVKLGERTIVWRESDIMRLIKTGL